MFNHVSTWCFWVVHECNFHIIIGKKWISGDVQRWSIFPKMVTIVITMYFNVYDIIKKTKAIFASVVEMLLHNFHINGQEIHTQVHTHAHTHRDTNTRKYKHRDMHISGSKKHIGMYVHAF